MTTEQKATCWDALKRAVAASATQSLYVQTREMSRTFLGMMGEIEVQVEQANKDQSQSGLATGRKS